MDKITKPHYSTATSLTARQINRRIILNIIYRHQPISRADTARETGLQRSTVSLIVDELIKDGWIVEGEHGRIPRGRRPIYLQLNASGAALYSVFLRSDSIELSASDLNGECLWVGREPLSGHSLQSIAATLQHLRSDAQTAFRHQIKGVGVAIEGIETNPAHIRATISEIFGAPVAVGSVALACAKWFLLNHKDAKLAHNNLLSVHVDDDITMGAIIEGRPLTGAHGRAVNLLPLTDAHAACSTETATVAQSGGTARRNGALKSGDCIEKVAAAMTIGVAAYDPGVVLIAGDFASNPGSAEQRLVAQLEESGAEGTHVRVVDTSGEGHEVYRRGAMGLILSQFLDENGQ